MNEFRKVFREQEIISDCGHFITIYTMQQNFIIKIGMAWLLRIVTGNR